MMFIPNLKRALAQLTALTTLTLCLPLCAAAAQFQDVLDTPAKKSELAAKSMLNGVAQAGQRVVAVGQRGHIVVSDDAGKTWRQAAVPVSSDLVAVSFPSPLQGWAVGHDGVVLHSVDGGLSWVKQLDGRMIGKLLKDYYAEQAAKNKLGSAEQSAALLDEMASLEKQGAENPFLDVWFSDQQTGYIIGAFNLIFRTADGGKTWQPWYHRTDNPKRLHLYAIRQVGAGLYIAGEQGLVLKLDSDAEHFSALNTGYGGSFFGIVGTEQALLVHGLRGNVYRSMDGGKQWQKIETGLQDGVTGSASCANQALLLVSQSGRMIVSEDAGARFVPVKLEQPMPASAVLCNGVKSAIIVGMRGVRTQSYQY